MFAKGALNIIFYSQCKFAAAVAAAVVIVAGAGVAVAQKSNAPANPPRTAVEPHLFAPQRLAQLNLTADQQQQIADLEAGTLAKLKAAFTPAQFQQWWQKKETQLKLIDNRLNLTADQQAQLEDLVREHGAEFLTALEPILTPAQLQQLKQNEAKHWPFVTGLNLTTEQWTQVSDMKREQYAAMKSQLEMILDPEQLQQWEARQNLTDGLNLTAKQQKQIAEDEAKDLAQLEKILTPAQFGQLLH